MICVDWFVASVGSYLLQDRVCDCLKHPAKNLLFELREALVGETWDGTGLNIEAIKVLEEALHPLDHDLVVGPAMLKLFKQVLPCEHLKQGAHLLLEVVADVFGEAIVKVGLVSLHLLDAKLIYLRVDFHVLLFGEDNFFVACCQECFQRNQRLLSQVLPVSGEYIIVVNNDVVSELSVCRWVTPRPWQLLLLSHHGVFSSISIFFSRHVFVYIIFQSTRKCHCFQI